MDCGFSSIVSKRIRRERLTNTRTLESPRGGVTANKTKLVPGYRAVKTKTIAAQIDDHGGTGAAPVQVRGTKSLDIATCKPKT